MGEVTEKIYCCDRGDKGYSFQIGSNNIANVLHGFDADNYIGTKTMVLPAECEVNGLVAITEQQHDEYMKLIEEKIEAEMRLKIEEVNDAQE